MLQLNKILDGLRRLEGVAKRGWCLWRADLVRRSALSALSFPLGCLFFFPFFFSYPSLSLCLSLLRTTLEGRDLDLLVTGNPCPTPGSADILESREELMTDSGQV